MDRVWPAGRPSPLLLLLAAGLLAAGCARAGPDGYSGRTTPPSTTAPGSPSTTAGAPPASSVVWLCRPGTADDPCAVPLSRTVVAADGARSRQVVTAAANSRFDCFFVYPTVSTEPGENADLVVQPAERAAAVEEAAQFSSVCSVWAPMYRQRTLASLAAGLGADASANTVAYDSIRGDLESFLAHDDDGRPIVFIGHSQGAAMLILLLRHLVDDDPALRARMVSALLLGGNVTVPAGRLVGGTFSHLPLCDAPAATGCVIAYSSFPSEPPAAALFGRPGQGVSLQSGQSSRSGEVACVNPAAVGSSGSGLLDTVDARAVPDRRGDWFDEYPDRYTARCEQAGGASWLQVTPTGGAADLRPVITEALGPLWGYHLGDVTLALGNLVEDVAAEEAAWSGR